MRNDQAETPNGQILFQSSLFLSAFIPFPSKLVGLPLTISTCQLIRSLYHFIQSGRRLDCIELEPTLSRCVAQILRVQLEHFVRALAKPELAQKVSYES